MYPHPFVAINASDLDMWLMDVGVMGDVLDVVDCEIEQANFKCTNCGGNIVQFT